MHRIPPEIEEYWAAIYGEGNFWRNGKYVARTSGSYRLIASTYDAYRKVYVLPLVIGVADEMNWVYRLGSEWYSESDMLRLLKLRAFL
jgi:hypothetical protein